MAVIAMTREMATRGSEVAAGLADRLGLAIIHHEIVEHDIAERTGMPESEVHRFLEGETSLLERWTLDRKRMSRYTAQEILELAAKGNVLIRGWGATYLLKSVPHVICVRICAPMPFREKVLIERLGVGIAANAKREIERNDAAHNGTMQRLFGIDWEDPSLYATVLNTARVPVVDCVEQIIRLAESPTFQETPEIPQRAYGSIDPCASAVCYRSPFWPQVTAKLFRRACVQRQGVTHRCNDGRTDDRRGCAPAARRCRRDRRGKQSRPHRLCSKRLTLKLKKLPLPVASSLLAGGLRGRSKRVDRHGKES